MSNTTPATPPSSDLSVFVSGQLQIGAKIKIPVASQVSKSAGSDFEVKYIAPGGALTADNTDGLASFFDWIDTSFNAGIKVDSLPESLRKLEFGFRALYIKSSKPSGGTAVNQFDIAVGIGALDDKGTFTASWQPVQGLTISNLSIEVTNMTVADRAQLALPGAAPALPPTATAAQGS